jgi:AcrR family transcriptional regulator
MATAPAPVPPRKKRRPHRRDEILLAAAQLFDEKGYHATGMDDIGSVAGMTGPAIYRHFKSKEDLLETLLLDSMGAFVDRATAIVATVPDPADAIDALVADYIAALFESPGLAAVAAYERRNLRPEIRAEVGRAERSNFDAWAGPLAAIHPGRSAAELRAMVQGACAMAVAMAAARGGLNRTARIALITEMVHRALDLPTLDTER